MQRDNGEDFNQEGLVEQILSTFHQTGLLEHLVFIGSWCVHFYQHHFKEANFQRIRTTDIDINVHPLLKAKNPVHIPSLLKPLDFDIHFAGDNYIFLIHPALKIEFLSPEKGRGTDLPLKIPAFGITATRLRYLDLLEREIITVDYKGLPVRVPHPVWFATHKLIISQRRRSKAHNERTGQEGKTEKDILHGIEVLEMLVRQGERQKIVDVYNGLTRKQKDYIRDAVRGEVIINRLKNAGLEFMQ